MTSVQLQLTTPAAQAALLRVDDLAKSYGGVHAVAGVSFDVPRGRITGLIGPNGAGKSTALGMIAGAIKPSQGSVLLNGTNVAGWPSHKIARRGLARTFQQSSDFAGMTVTENLLTARYGQRGDTLRGALGRAIDGEVMKLESQVSVLSTAVTGGPFLGLLGSSWGVMSVFAAMGEYGTVRLGAVAPGISAALLATVVGLLVAVPSLFAYNWLAQRIRH